MELELVDQELEFGFWLGVARQHLHHPAIVETPILEMFQ